MIWLTWHQHRREAQLGGLILLFALALLALSGSVAYSTADKLGLAACHVGASDSAACGTSFTAFMQQFLSVSIYVAYALAILPALLGVFVGAPLLAREVEQETHVLVWTQSITRLRWFAAEAGWIAAVSLVAAAALAALAAWWHRPFDVIFGSGIWHFFDVFGLVPVAYALFALVLGLAAGTVIQRTVPAMAATLLAFTALRVAITQWRPWFRPPVMHEATFGKPGFPQDALQVGLYWVDRTNHQVPYERINEVIQQAFPGSIAQSGAIGLNSNNAASIGRYLNSQGFHYIAAYQPFDRFWTFQAIEAGIFMAGALLLAALTVWWLDRVR